MTAGVPGRVAAPLAMAVAALALAPCGALAQSRSDEVVATAQSGAGAPATSARTAEVKATPPSSDADADKDPLPDRKVHGEVSVGMGTNGYRDVSGVVEGPVGDQGQMMIAIDAGSENAPARGR